VFGVMHLVAFTAEQNHLVKHHF